ncbi:MAG TPA: NADP-dependent phosphogluconate dehydrogenase [Chitinophagaceae bacterium]|nr:NADP-dependent phosphogluconate dehydrogenase [Chitinophagaceae bacterium]
MTYRLGIIGLGTMGRNLLLNMADHNFPGAGYDKDPAKLALLETEGKDKPVKSFPDIASFVNSLQQPRVVLLLVPAGAVVDAVINELRPILSKGDIIIDGGNSHFTDTSERIKKLSDAGLHFFGMGISGGEEGARTGPSLMPGGDKEAYLHVKEVLEAIAAKVDGNPCVTYIGPGASGHFVKMVHNGIEYAMMQLIADTYELLKKGCGMNNEQLHQLFSQWNKGKLQSYLLEITADIFTYKYTDGGLLLDQVRDEAKAKGTGKWTTQVSTELELPVPAIDVAVAMRDLSKYKSLRTQMAAEYDSPVKKMDAGKLEDAFYFSMINIYAQGMHLLQRASEAYNYDLNMPEIARIWQGGCIIRAALLKLIRDAYMDEKLPHLLLDEDISSIIKHTAQSAREVSMQAINAGISVPVYLSSLSYFDAIRSAHMPVNLVQAQRDYFGAHTYELIGKEGAFHTEWNKLNT